MCITHVSVMLHTTWCVSEGNAGGVRPYWGVLVIDVMLYSRESIHFPQVPKRPLYRTLVLANATLKCTTVIVHERSRWLPRCFCLLSSPAETT